LRGESENKTNNKKDWAAYPAILFFVGNQGGLTGIGRPVKGSKNDERNGKKIF